MKISEHFQNDLWEQIILPAIQVAESQIDDKFSKSVEFKKTYQNDNYVEYLSTLYEEKREWLKKIYFTQYQNSKHLLDMHKIASVICRCMIGCKPFSFDVFKANEFKEENNKNNDLKWIIDNYFINYKVAFNCALGITLYDLIDRLEESEKTSTQSLKIDYKDATNNFLEKGFDLYERDPKLLFTKHEYFYKSMILDLAINDIEKRDFDYLAFAANCFQIQQYELLKFEYMKKI